MSSDEKQNISPHYTDAAGNIGRKLTGIIPEAESCRLIRQLFLCGSFPRGQKSGGFRRSISGILTDAPEADINDIDIKGNDEDAPGAGAAGMRPDPRRKGSSGGETEPHE